MRRKAVVAVVAMLLCLSLVACSAGPKPEETVKAFIDAMGQAKFEAANAYLSPESQGTDEIFEPEDANAERLFIALFSRLTYELGEPNISGDSATVSVSITAPNMAPIVASVMGEMFGAALALAFSEEGPSEELMNEMWITSFETKIKAADAPMVTNTVTVKLTKSDGNWVIEADEAFADALVGNLITAFEDFNFGE
ncbi:MAG: hypothetical protein ACOX2K_02375 [Bacillota bacterium]